MSDADSLERELKFAVESLAELRQRLVEIDAERQHPSAFEDNLVFDRAGELAAAGHLLRLRRDRRGARLTFKGKQRFEGDVKVRREYETHVDDPDKMHQILESLGYEVTQRYQKRREEWRLGSVTVALDHTPIGDYAEFEGAAAEKLAARCGLPAEAAEPRTYLRLYADYREEHPEAPPDMVFP